MPSLRSLQHPPAFQVGQRGVQADGLRLEGGQEGAWGQFTLEPRPVAACPGGGGRERGVASSSRPGPPSAVPVENDTDNIFIMIGVLFVLVVSDVFRDEGLIVVVVGVYGRLVFALLSCCLLVLFWP